MAGSSSNSGSGGSGSGASDYATTWLTDKATSMDSFFDNQVKNVKKFNDDWLNEFKEDKTANAKIGRIEEQIAKCITLRSNLYERFQSADILTLLMGRGAFEAKSE